jgi:precorrin-8X/cobalt-precorrin-8 methylmutase
MPEFDAYLMVDWSASSRPVTGKDSVWYCLVIRNGDNVSVAAHENPPTRRQAVTEINDILRGLARRAQMVLVGFEKFGHVPVAALISCSDLAHNSG